jgi:crotonobetainyl-CoA:carnitine CoA-transferase CaiB-like acyl-CoA transferase
MTNATDLPKPLDGIRVVDLTAIIFGPMATQQLANLGAEVIKVEVPGGDVVRHVEPMRSPGMGAIFMNSNRAKKSLVLDLKTAAGQDALKRLVATADVFVHSMRGQAARRLGIDYASLKAIKPDLVHCFACGYGSEGPNAELPAYDDIIQAATGLAAVTTDREGTPQLIRTIVADKVGALYLANALLAAIMTLRQTGRGQAIEVPMFECLAHFMLVEHMAAASFEPAMGPAGYKRVLSANRKTYRTKDGYVALLPYTTAQWRRFLELVGETELAAQPWVNDPTLRSARIGELYAVIAGATPARATEEWIEALRAVDIPVAAVNTLDDLMVDPQLQATGLIETYEHPTEGLLKGTRTPVKGGWAAAETPAIAPKLGEHNREILGALGFSDAEVVALSPAAAG